MEFETATGQAVKIYCLKKLLTQLETGRCEFDLVIMNNDLIGGIPESLKRMCAPIYPSPHAGWHARQKSHHFAHTADLMTEFARILDSDPWLFSTIYAATDHVNINEESDRKKIADMANDLLRKINLKYREHGIPDKPYLVLKADAGTYGMGVLPIEDPQEILTLNRKDRNKLYKGKGAQVIERYLIQEGIPTIHLIEDQVSEVVIYQIANNLIGGFYRSHSEKSNREILNSQGMNFKKMCPHLSKYGDCGIHHDVNIFDVYRILARIAGIAAHREIVELETAQK